MSKLGLYFFAEEEYIDFPKTLQSLKELITKLFLLTKNNLNKINFCYNNNDSSLLLIKSEKDYKSFLKKNINNIYLDAGQNYEIYEEFISKKEKKEDNEDLKRFNELEKKMEEIKKFYESEIKDGENQLNDINKLMKDLYAEKESIVFSINENKKKLEKEEQKINDELSVLKKKLGK